MRALFLVALTVVSSASATLFQDCGSVGSDVLLNVENCEMPPCQLVRGTTMALNIQFTSSRTSDALEIDATANIAGINVPWPGIDTNGCLQLESSSNPCPYEAGSRVDWSMGVDVLKEYPAISTVVTFRLRDSAGEPQACTVVPVTIV